MPGEDAEHINRVFVANDANHRIPVEVPSLDVGLKSGAMNPFKAGSKVSVQGDGEYEVVATSGDYVLINGKWWYVPHLMQFGFNNYYMTIK
ncbi:MAG: hypothetical protein H6839_09805 [Planctomycetes bacterium]|nr:hypothetical protein [Planctomycetota bacterium]